MNRDVSDRLDGLVDVNRRDLLRGIAVTPIAGVSLSEVASADEGVEISVRQNGSEVATVSPITTDRSIGNFYRYDEIDGASANTPMNLREDGASKLFFYRQRGGEKISLVVIHDAPNNGNGGDARFEFQPNPLPEGDGWVVQDDPGDGNYSRTAADWRWVSCCTDGGAYRGGFEDGTEVTIDPAFNDGIDHWDLLDGDGSVVTDLSMTGSITITVGPSSIEGFVDQKLALAGHIDDISYGNANDRTRVEPTLQELLDAVDDGTLDEDVAIDTTERMLWGEQVTDAALAAAGNGSSVHLEGDYNIAKGTAELAINPFLVVFSLILGIGGVLRRIPRLSDRLSGFLNSLKHGLADFLEYVLGNRAAARLVRENGEDAGEDFLSLLIDMTLEEGRLGVDTIEEALEESEVVSTFVEDTASELFTDVLFEGAYQRDDEDIPTISEVLDVLNEELGIEDGGPSFDGDQSTAAQAADEQRAAIEGKAEHVSTVLEDGLAETIKTIFGLISLLTAVLAVVASILSGGTSLPVTLPTMLAALSGVMGIGAVSLEAIQRGSGIGGLKSMAVRNAVGTHYVLNSAEYSGG